METQERLPIGGEIADDIGRGEAAHDRAVAADRMALAAKTAGRPLLPGILDAGGR